jgi:hypothetical protein
MMLGDELVSPGLQQELDGRIEDANGNILAVRNQLEEELHSMEAKQDSSVSPAPLQRKVALLLGEIAYLDHKLSVSSQEIGAKRQGLWERIQTWVRPHAPQAQ